jgi:predicted DNA-binding protein
MRLFNFMIADSLDTRLRSESERSGVPMSVIARRALERYLTIQDMDRLSIRADDRGNCEGQATHAAGIPEKTV